jgi:hypothetical protein
MSLAGYTHSTKAGAFLYRGSEHRSCHWTDRRMQTSSSSSVCGVGGIPPNALQPTEAYCADPAF